MKSSKPLLSNKIEDINSKLNEDELNNFTADCLKRYCKENSIQVATTKANIIINLLAHFNNNAKQPLNDLSNIQNQQPKMKSILKKDVNNKDNKENKENIKEIIDKVENLTIDEKNKEKNVVKTRKQALEKYKQEQFDDKQEDNEINSKKKVTFNSVNQIGFVERKERNHFKYYINTNQNSPIKNESPLKIVNNQSYNIFDFIGEEEEEFDTETMKIWELKEALEINGLSTEGDKQELKERLESFIVETLNKDNEKDSLNESVEEDWIRWTPLKAKNSGNKKSTTDNDKKSKSKTTKKTIKSKSKPSKKSKKHQDEEDDEDEDDESYDYDEDKDTPIMTSQQLFNAFIDVSVTNNKKK
ncbi:hypothetical protein DICPUDRAFT_158888 [Dictyostelium purpureum]|uniref:SAP domain-containing protein n=1 Tax=Dictyostelium purpureum TaxID=5786 RepID=F1A2R7_DICPU|nr:uncharacterized protein DICPUDRAFT_158888 [Dictyostelium purpureum]EGC29513.1 hypothetical protein DICPUDRAFT_158888 [Dictyostelium purpureum]|eukprot:XP_003293957.1 hypothetical protein DICPUDRAFT_158888 [Dictyostelium purpureum]